MKNVFTARLAFCLILCFAGFAVLAQNAPEPIGAQFDKRYAAWLEWSAGQPERALLTIGDEFRELVDLGPQAAPYFAEKMLTVASPREAVAMAEALARVTEKRFARALWPEGKYLDPAIRLELYSRWWKEGRQQTSTDFDRLYARWKELKAKGDLVFQRDSYIITYDDEQKNIIQKRDQQRTELADVYDAINDMGVDVLPLLVEKFVAKDYDMLPIFRELTHIVPRGRDVAERVAYCVKWWDANRGEWLIPEN